jgi:hypothetical protein
MRKQIELTAPPAWVNSRHGLTEGKAIRFTEEVEEVSEWKETAAIFAFVCGMVVLAAVL